MKRRDFFRIIGGLTASLILPSYTLAREKKLLRNEDKKGFYIRFYRPFEAVDSSAWTLNIDGLCETPQTLSFSDLYKLPKVTQVSRLKCVECWSAKARWSGFEPRALFEMALPLNTAKFLYFYSADGYCEYISLADLLRPRVLFAYEMNGEPLPDEHGAPLRLIMPFKYGYKSVKAITKLTFVDKDGDGYWSAHGYSRDATILPGEDFPLDIGEPRTIKKPGELDY